MNIKFIAFYLPQYHPIPENNRFWGEGFTEWKFVANARPLFRHHYQPRIPGELGFYDLRFPEFLEAQVNLAKSYGIDAFCFYFYHFNGKSLLYKPIENFLENKNLNLEYCLCWANENWTRRWDGADNHILLKQNYFLDDMKNLIHFFAKHFKEDRYLRYKGKPILLIYRFFDIPIWKEISVLWREECYKQGLGEIHIAGVIIRNWLLKEHPSKYHLDSYVMFPPNWMDLKSAKEKVVDLKKSFVGSIYDYDEAIEHDLKYFNFGYQFPIHRGIMLSWDNTPRVKDSSRLFIGYTPLRYAYWLRKIIEQELFFNCNEESLIFINAWNEWGEGTYLEPDDRFGRTTLKLTRLLKEEIKEKTKELDKFSKLKDSLLRNNDNYIPHLEVPNKYSFFKGYKEAKKNAINILMVSHVVSPQLYGAERSLLDLLKLYNEIEEFNIYVAVNSISNEDYINQLKEFSCGVFLVDYKQWLGRKIIEIGPLLQFADIIVSYSIDIVYVNTITILEASIAAKKLKVLSVTHVREIISEDKYLSFEIGYHPESIKKSIYNRSDILICNSKSTLIDYKDFNWKYYLPNMVDFSLQNQQNFNGAINNIEKNHEKIIFGIISSNTPKKGILNIVSLARLLNEYKDKIEIWIVGPINSYIKYIQERLKDENITFVKFIDYVTSPYELIKQIDVILSLSEFAESFGRTVAEAAALGKPVIAFNKGAIKEIVKHGETGYLAKYKDINEVADYVKKFINEPYLIEEMGRKARESIDVYHFDKVKRIAKEIWRDVFQKMKIYPKIKREIKVSIIIPVFNAPKELDLCLKYLMKHTTLNENTELLIIDDCSIHPEVYNILNDYKEVPFVRIYHNPHNLGYTKTINKGIKLAGDRDVILLNSDTIPTPLWLEGLRATAYMNDKIGTVTAMSDNAGYFSFPEPNKNNPKPEEVTYEEYALRILQNCYDLDYVEVPTGNGFCMYIKRELINDIGLFDEEAFPFGYGEENDFCMRAMRKGWKNVLTPWSFVYHHKSASFGIKRDELVKKALGIIKSRYIEYEDLVKKCFNSENMIKIRERVSNVRNFYNFILRKK
ncbi:MAG: glycoside hydrolase family 99-like domain-containing protein [Candidatus Aenigmatarchaeota archaeon]